MLVDLQLKKHLQSLIERDNCHPFKASAVMWIQLPLWISMSFALRNMVSMMPNQDLGIIVVITFCIESND